MMNEFEKYPKIYMLGHKNTLTFLDDPPGPIHIQEKIDGANFRFMIHDGSIIFGTHHTTIDPTDKSTKSFKRVMDYITEQLEGKDLSAYEGAVFFGEGCWRHSIPYDFENMPIFLGYDVLNYAGEWLTPTVAQLLFEDLGLEFVPRLSVVHSSELIQPTDESVPQSKYYPGQAEGVVFKRYYADGSKAFAKYVTEKHRETAKTVFGGSPKFAGNDNQWIVDKYCRNARIDKKIFELLNEGRELEMALMTDLPKRVIEDMYEEHGFSLLTSKSLHIDTNLVRKLITRRCVAALKMMITNRMFE